MSHRHAIDALVLEVSEDEAVSRSPVVFCSVAFHPQAQRAGGSDDAKARTYQMHLSKLASVPCTFGLPTLWIFFPYVVLFVLGEVMGALGTRKELASASVAHIGLEAPPKSPLVSATHGLGFCLTFLCLRCFLILSHSNSLFFILVASDTTISGWAGAIHAVYSDIGGTLPCLFMVFNFWSRVLYAFLVFRSPPP
jgi:hypothetical protein